ncbi:MAG TPA: pyridoxamine 5'-phosphate oxidase family protein [Anaeromyxobacter sp.]
MPDDRDYATLLAGYRTALLTTRSDDGHLHCRPMAMRQQVRGEEIWFATALRSNKCRDLGDDPRCALAFFDAEDGTTLSISGRGEVISDRRLALTLWDPSWSRWFPGGPAQRGVALVRVIPERVERHDGRTGKLEVLYATRRGSGARRLRYRRRA